jgi:hypothetical protein
MAYLLLHCCGLRAAALSFYLGALWVVAEALLLNLCVWVVRAHCFRLVITTQAQWVTPRVHCSTGNPTRGQPRAGRGGISSCTGVALLTVFLGVMICWHAGCCVALSGPLAQLAQDLPPLSCRGACLYVFA